LIWRQFRGGHSKRGVWLLEVFFLHSLHIWQGLKEFLHLSEAKEKELAEEITTP
jgi:hypothetical protein